MFTRRSLPGGADAAGLGVEHDRDRAIVDELDCHARPENSMLHGDSLGGDGGAAVKNRVGYSGQLLEAVDPAVRQ